MQGFRVSECQHCKRFCLWDGKQLVYPPFTTAPLPNPELPDAVRRDYEEARSIVAGSPRGAAALLRLAIQKLCQHLGEPGKNLNADIGSLVKKGLTVRVQQALDVVRVTGNNAVHPGQIELSDDVERASRLFMLVNIIADQMITQPKHVEELFNALPEEQRAQIEKRDQN